MKKCRNSKNYESNRNTKKSIELKAPNLWNKEISLSRNDILVQTGTIYNWIYYVQSRTLQICVESENEIHTTRFAYRGSLVTVVDFFLGIFPLFIPLKPLENQT